MHASFSRRSFLTTGILASTGIGISVAYGRTIRPAIATGTPEANPTVEALLNEIATLEAKLAEEQVCTPAATATPEPTATLVPPIPYGTPIGYGGIWTITVLGAFDPPPADYVALGRLVQVDLSFLLNSTDSERPPWSDFQLIETSGQRRSVDLHLNQTVIGPRFSFSMDPGIEETRSVVFDVAADAEPTFILESTVDPQFRVAVGTVVRG
jgi:hypothetical protein